MEDLLDSQIALNQERLSEGVRGVRMISRGYDLYEEVARASMCAEAVNEREHRAKRKFPQLYPGTRGKLLEIVMRRRPKEKLQSSSGATPEEPAERERKETQVIRNWT